MIGARTTMGCHNRKKELRESYAFQVLQFIDKIRYGRLEKSESPDFLDPDHGIGVEVSYADYEDAQEMESLFSKLEKSEDRNAKKIKSKLDRKGAKLLYDSRGSAEAIILPAQWATFEPIETIYLKKLKKLNSSYTPCSDNELFIYTEIGPDNEGWKGQLPRLRSLSTGFRIHFNRVILNEPFFLAIFEIDADQYARIPFTEDDYNRCRELSRQNVLEH